MVDKLALSPKEVAEALGLGESTVRRLIKRGVIPATRLHPGKGSRQLIAVETLQRLLRGEIPTEEDRDG